MEAAKRAIILLSGGLDSATVAALARERGFDLYALSFSYGQRHAIELAAARKVAQAAGVNEHKIANLDLRLFGGSALTDDIDVPKDRPAAAMETDIPVTYVPARNTIFLSFALAYAEVVDATHIFIGVNALDYSGYPDCRPDYIAAYQAMARLATASGVTGQTQVTLEAPLMTMTKAQIIREGQRLGVDYGLTLSCYDPDEAGLACGHCDSCILRKKGFLEAGVADPTRYRDAAHS